MSGERVAVTGLGLVTPFGTGVEPFWQALCDGAVAARAWPDLEAAGFRVPIACRVTALSESGPHRGRALASVAAEEALASAGMTPSGEIGVFVGTTMGESAAFEAAAEGQPLALDEATAQSFPKALQATLGVTGPARAYATACAAGNYAIGSAAAAVAAGDVPAALAGGVEPFSRIALVGFSRVRAMARERCRPFDRRRDGMLLGEAAAFMVLEPERAALVRGAPVLATVTALGLSCDAYHATAPRPDGSGMAAAMRRALAEGGVSPDEVGWVCAHGSGTRASDTAEAAALHAVFGAAPPPVSSLKGAVGHSLGAATAVEAVATVLALARKTLPPTGGTAEPDADLALDVITETRSAPNLRWALNCGYAFGGLNAALLLEAA